MVERREEGSGVTGTMDKAQKGPKIGHGSARKTRTSRNLQQTVAKKTTNGVVGVSGNKGCQGIGKGCRKGEGVEASRKKGKGGTRRDRSG